MFLIGSAPVIVLHYYFLFANTFIYDLIGVRLDRKMFLISSHANYTFLHSKYKKQYSNLLLTQNLPKIGHILFCYGINKQIS
jgi:hypothetical protein